MRLNRDIVVWKLFPHIERLGFHLTRNHFYEPIPDTRTLGDEIFERDSQMVGVDLAEERQLQFLKEVVPLYRDEYLSFDRAEVQSGRFHLANTQFERVDAEVLHCMVRSSKPRRVVEIGGGFSTLVTSVALQLNAAEGHGCEFTTIEPYPRQFLLDGVPRLTHLIQSPVQEVPLSTFESLEAGDILFIDSSHVVRIGSDAQYELLEVLPRVAPGVLVQVHDVFFPRDYPRIFVKEWHRFWNEQYVLQAFLAFNDSFEVRWGSALMAHRHPEALAEAFPSFAQGGLWPSSFWLQRVQSPRLDGA